LGDFGLPLTGGVAGKIYIEKGRLSCCVTGVARISAPFLLLLFLAPVHVLSAGDPDIIDVLYISRALFQGPKTNPMLTPDPSISLMCVPMPGHTQLGTLGKDLDVLNRYMRIYMPRNYGQLVTERDIVVMFEAPRGIVQYPGVYFDQKWISWFVKGVQEDGMSLLMMGGDASWGGGWEGANYYQSWGETTLDEILPFVSLEGTNPSAAAPQRPEFAEGHPLSRLPWREARFVELLNKVKPKQGSTLIAEAVRRDVRYPWIATWKIGEGRTVGETQIFGSKDTSNFMLFEWEWYQDFVIFLTYLGANKPIPADVYRAHRMREEINLHLEKNSLLISLFEFIEKFGASTVDLYTELDAINARADDAKDYYRRDDYDTASEIFEEVHAAIDELNGKAIEAKENALTWVYIIEWFSVSGVGLTSGVVVWMLMVRRWLYRVPGTTRAAQQRVREEGDYRKG
jgi:uncharacterized membrane protein